MEATLSNLNHIKSFFECLTAIRKVSDDIIFCCTPAFISVRALNNAQTSLPVLIFKESFFGEYIYTSNKDSMSFQILGQCIKYMKKISIPSSIKISFNPNNTTINFELIDRYEIVHIFDFYTSEASVFDAVQSSESLLSATIGVDELYYMRNTFKCPYIILSYIIDEDGDPCLSFESFNSLDTAKQSVYTLKNSCFCNIKTNNDCRIVISYVDFITIIKIAHVTSDHVEIIAGEPGKALIIKACNGSSSLKLEASIATLASDDYIASALSSQVSSLANQTGKTQKLDNDTDEDAHSISPPESPLRKKSMSRHETQLTESGRLTSSNNSQCSTTTQVIPWKQDSYEFSASPEFPSKRKHSDIVIERSQPTDDEYDDENEEREEPPTRSPQKYF